MAEDRTRAPALSTTNAGDKEASHPALCDACGAQFGIVGFAGFNAADAGELSYLDPVFCPRCGRPFEEAFPAGSEELVRQRVLRSLKMQVDASAPQGQWSVSGLVNVQTERAADGTEAAQTFLVRFRRNGA